MADGVTGFYASRPSIRVDGQPRPELGDALLVSLLVEETLLGLFRCEARLLNWGPKQGQVGFLFFDGQVLDFGKSFAVELGPPGASRRVFAGRIMGLEAHYPPNSPPELVVLAEDRFQDLRMTRRSRGFADASDADVVQRIASTHGLSAQVDADGPTHRLLAQLDQSDLAFLRERAVALDADLWMEDDTLHCVRRSRRNVDTVTLSYGATLLEFSVLADLAHQRGVVRVSGWDPTGKQAIEAEAGEAAISGELEGRRGGATVLAATLGERQETVAADAPLSQAEAQHLAEARFRARARGFLRGVGIADGTAAIRVGGRVELTGLGAPFDGPYTVTLVRHAFDLRDGYRTTFEVERPGLGNWV